MNDKDYWLENMLDGFFAQERKKERDNFWNNHQPKQHLTQQERDTVNALTSFIPVVNGAPSKKPVPTKTRRRLESGGVTARV
ncbi:hypothetical protein [Xenorhabdus hominickii]|uniref:Uncharacterized protein n=1 Tax=Xenorhabdus hominickii TaxID=351679 RepID=A0A2G0Q260_XENHO|nr:hypothetical protein [Xenorhabdus hominickii]AOM40207.1 hypothetical protein A9255_06210 [Xenorhabdus hominickii]PHM53291.1 hypothetical protein Xhom_04186 [Xenorhabdus hominickii]